ncbi:MAG: hypothetical protein EZS26_002277 [Candidatus Ordinivivax streblomastigis]|uniref:Uncharacterized protein n=1 Tax=Candidatus Ordinivivax streblomastigis TaxID=2540710 RepID=A0A5M8NZE9_9BACT|nr:MAG: hypothetical protein EZS26_002277 [Candidatus Ordinivivax streblomastigis]
MNTIEFQQDGLEEEAIRRYSSDENPAITGHTPKGYMTGEEFFSKLKADVTKMYKDRGLL